MKLEDLMGEVSDDEYVVYDRNEKLAAIFGKRDLETHGSHVEKRLFRILDNGDVEEINLDEMVGKLADALKERIDVRELLVQVLRVDTPPKVLLQINELLTLHPEAAKEATVRPGCLYLDIPDPRPGKENIPLYLRD